MSIVLYALIVILPLVVAEAPNCECNAPNVSDIRHVIEEAVNVGTLVISWHSLMIDELRSRCNEIWQLNYNWPEHTRSTLPSCLIEGNFSLAYPYVCPLKTSTSCHLSPKCFLSHGKLDIQLVGINSCREITEVQKLIKLRHGLDTKALPVINLTLESLTSRSAIIQWDFIASDIITFPDRINYYNVTDQYANIITSGNTSENRVNQANLKPNSHYTFLVATSYMYRHERNERNPPSDARSTRFMTLEDVPGAAPGLSPGSYSLCSTDTLTCIQIYYQDVPKPQQHGEIIWYSVNVRSCPLGKHLYHETWIHSKISHSKAIHLRPIDESSLKDGFIMELRAGTKVGLSSVSADLYISNLKSLLGRPANVSAEMHNNMNEITVHIHWNNSAIYKHGSTPQNFTIHYCEGLYLETPVKCIRNYHYLTLSGNATAHILYLPLSDVQVQNYRFGVSVMSNDNISTGITWSDCLYEYSQDPEAPPYTVQNITDTGVISLLVKWQPSCNVFTTVISLSYQLHDDKLLPECGQGTVQDASWSDMADTDMLISHLLPLTSYVICIRAYNGHGPGAWRYRRIIKTTEIPIGPALLHVIVPATVVPMLVISLLMSIIMYFCRERLKKLCKPPETVLPGKDDAHETWTSREISPYDVFDSPPTLSLQSECPLKGASQCGRSIDMENPYSTKGLLASPTSSEPQQLPVTDTSGRNIHSFDEDFSHQSGSQDSITYFDLTENGTLVIRDEANVTVVKSDERKSLGYVSRNGDDSKNNGNSDSDSDINMCNDVIADDEKKNINALEYSSVNLFPLPKDTGEQKITDDKPLITEDTPLIMQDTSSSVISDTGDEMSCSSTSTIDSRNNDLVNNDSAISVNNDFGNNDFPSSGSASYSKLSLLPDNMMTRHNDDAYTLFFLPIVGDSHGKDTKDNESVGDKTNRDPAADHTRIIMSVGDKTNHDPAVDHTQIVMNVHDRTNPDPAEDHTQIIMGVGDSRTNCDLTPDHAWIIMKAMCPVMDKSVQNVAHAPYLQSHTDHCLIDVDDNSDDNVDDSVDDNIDNSGDDNIDDCGDDNIDDSGDNNIDDGGNDDSSDDNNNDNIDDSGDDELIGYIPMPDIHTTRV